MRPRFKKNNQQGIIPAILALIIGLVCIIILVLVLALIVYFNHIIAGLIGGGNQPPGFYGAGNCATTQTFDGVTLPKAKGPLSSEQHLATTAESFPSGWPTNSNDQAERHYQVTNFSVNCPGCPKEGFTPAEGGGNVGGGTGVKPDPKVEPWIMNVLEDLPINSKVIIRSTKTGKTVVAAGGYEKGPSSTKFAGGAQYEVLHALGIEHEGEVEIGFAQDQNLPYGPVICGGGTNIVGSGQCAIPVAHYTLTKKGYLAHMSYGLHRGLDFSVPNGTPVYATMDGTIVESVDACQTGDNDGCNHGWGNFITIRHSNNFYSEYHHLAHGTLLAKGTLVKKGQQIALSDNNGTSTGPHLHFQLMTANDHNAHINPNPCLGKMPRSM